MPYFDIPLDLPHAGRIADRIVALLEKHTEEMGLDVPEVMDTADKLSSYLFRNAEGDDNPPNANEGRDQAALLGRQLVDAMKAAHLTGDLLAQLLPTLFEFPGLGKA